MRYTPLRLPRLLAARDRQRRLQGRAGNSIRAPRRWSPRAAASWPRARCRAAIDSFEAALAIDPAHTAVYLELAEAARAMGLQGKAIHYYREALERGPNNFAAISGEGEALLEKGAVDKARRNLAQLESLCGDQCAETSDLAAAPSAGRSATVLTAEAVPRRRRW